MDAKMMEWLTEDERALYNEAHCRNIVGDLLPLRPNEITDILTRLAALRERVAGLEGTRSVGVSTDYDHRIITGVSIALGGMIGEDGDADRLLAEIKSDNRERTLAEIAIAFIRWAQDLKAERRAALAPRKEPDHAK